jgi:hypothetical protein
MTNEKNDFNVDCRFPDVGNMVRCRSAIAFLQAGKAQNREADDPETGTQSAER